MALKLTTFYNLPKQLGRGTCVCTNTCVHTGQGLAQVLVFPGLSSVQRIFNDKLSLEEYQEPIEITF